jgi:hypothetical protein
MGYKARLPKPRAADRYGINALIVILLSLWIGEVKVLPYPM